MISLLLDIWDSISSKMAIHNSENLCKFTVRAKYFRTEDGGLRLANVCSFSRPVFNPDHLEESFDNFDVPEKVHDLEIPEDITTSSDPLADIIRSTRRAKNRCFDIIMCNKLNVFSTLTFDRNKIDRSCYDDVYKKLSIWLSNRVQRNGLMYVAVPEYHRDGENIHFHMLSNEYGLDLINSGHKRHGKPVYNILSWKWGFSTAQLVDGEDCQAKCAKYIFKYMGKQFGQKIGGRYYLSGGDFEEPVFLYSNDEKEFFNASDQVQYEREVDTDGGLYREWSFI